jgi:hypothetical protein
MTRCALVRVETPDIPEADPAFLARFQSGVHAVEGSSRRLIVTLSVDHYTLEEAHLRYLGIQSWLHVCASVAGQLEARLKDQRRIGRQRDPGERSPVPLPDWYDLTHITYEHPELGFDRTRDVYQIIPAPGGPYTNIVEALHLHQPL